MTQSAKPFKFRPFISFLTAFTFLFITITGIILYITPPGRIANWTNWTFWGFSRHQWVALHICFSALFVIVSLFHLYFNFKALTHYIVSRVQNVRRFRFEWVAALVVSGVVFWGSLKPFAPFSSLLDLNERAKNSWATNTGQPPVPHAEILTITELAEQVDLPAETLIANLKAKGIDAAAEDIFGDIADKAGYSPNQLFQIATGQAIDAGRGQQHGGGKGGSGSGQGQGGQGGGSGGFGQMTLKQACEDMGISLDTALQALTTAGITASADQTIRGIADQNNVHPSQIRQILETK